MANDCHQECINTNGSFTCECQEGFVLDSNTRTCSGMQYSLTSLYPWTVIMSMLDLQHTIVFIYFTVMPGNQCSQNNSCSQVCLRINGTLIEQCSCRRGYQLSSDNTTCDGIDMVMCIPVFIQSVLINWALSMPHVGLAFGMQL